MQDFHWNLFDGKSSHSFNNGCSLAFLWDDKKQRSLRPILPDMFQVDINGRLTLEIWLSKGFPAIQDIMDYFSYLATIFYFT